MSRLRANVFLTSDITSNSPTTSTNTNLAEEPLPASSPLWDLPNVLITPHVGGEGGRQQWRRMSELIRGNTRRYLCGEPPSMSSELLTARSKVFENALLAICLQIQARSQAAEERYRRGSRVRASLTRLTF